MGLYNIVEICSLYKMRWDEQAASIYQQQTSAKSRLIEEAPLRRPISPIDQSSDSSERTKFRGMVHRKFENSVAGDLSENLHVAIVRVQVSTSSWNANIQAVTSQTASNYLNMDFEQSR